MDSIRHASHPDTEQLRAFLRGSLPNSAATQLQQHLASCTHCRGHLERLDPVSPVADLHVGIENAPDTREAPTEAGGKQSQRTHEENYTSPEIEVRIPGYRVLSELGRGGMGIVYKALQEDLQRYVALKVLFQTDENDPLALMRFRQEAELLAGLNHPNIVQIYEVHLDEHPRFLVLEYVEGPCLSKRLAQGVLNADEAAHLVEQLARAISAAQESGIVHRDLKPSNVLWHQADATPKITDFGIARQLENGCRLTLTGDIVGTPSYMAPEQALGQRDEVGCSTDIYALGAILYQCLTGRAPFEAPTPAETMMQVVQQDPVPPGKLHLGLSRDLESVCLTRFLHFPVGFFLA